MVEQDVYDWVHKIQIPRVKKMGEGELLINYLARRSNGANELNTGPANLMNIIISDRLEELGFDRSVLDSMSDDDIRILAESNL